MSRTPLRWLGRIVGGLAALVLLVALVLYGMSEYRLRRGFDVPAVAVKVTSDSATLARGRHLATAIGKCVDCHGDDFAGKVFAEDPLLGRVAGPNLTRGVGGRGRTLGPADWDRAIRHGVHASGRPLIMMPSADYQFFTDEDLAAIVSYLQSVPPVDRTMPPSFLAPVGRALLATGKLPVLNAEVVAHEAVGSRDLDRTSPVSYGRYLAWTGGCHGCHGEKLLGGPVPGTPPTFPPAANLTMQGRIGQWSLADFTRALRTGTRPDGSKINDFMPWRLARDMTDDEIAALWAYLRAPRGGAAAVAN